MSTCVCVWASDKQQSLQHGSIANKWFSSRHPNRNCDAYESYQMVRWTHNTSGKAVTWGEGRFLSKFQFEGRLPELRYWTFSRSSRCMQTYGFGGNLLKKHKKEPNHLHSTLEILVNKYQKKQGDGFKIPSDHEPCRHFLSGQNLSPPLNSKGLQQVLSHDHPVRNVMASTWHNAFEFVGTNYLRSLSFACLKQVIRLWQFESKGLRASGQFRALPKGSDA